MAQSNKLVDLMETPLPSIAEQRRRTFRPTKRTVRKIFNLLNTHIFNNKLSYPDMVVRALGDHWGICIGTDTPYRYSTIRLHHHYVCVQWFVVVLAHEMIHQYQWDVIGPQRIAKDKVPLISHGPSFYQFRDKFATYGIPLKQTYRLRHWWKKQDLMKV